MSSRLRAALRSRIPALRRRDERLAELQSVLNRRKKQIGRLTARVHTLEAELAAIEQERVDTEREARRRARRENRDASFRRQILSLRNQVYSTADDDPQSLTASRQLPYKLRNYSLANSHGIGSPEILALWPDVAAIDLDSLPDRFVLKSDGGAGGRGVFPLERVGTDRFTIAGGGQSYTGATLKDRLHELGDRARPPFFAEAWLTARDQVGSLPHDVKIFAFYGEIGQILLRSVGTHGDNDSVRYRFLAADGTDLGNVSLASIAPIAANVPIPAGLGALLDVARHLSRCTGTPFVRVDVYDTPGGPTLGELTRAPGGPHRYRPEHDRLMGEMWLRAQTRLELDLMHGRPPGAVYGDHPSVDHYPAVAASGESGPATWPTIVRPCTEWCQQHRTG